MEFRDVFEADGQRIRDRDERLVKMFLEPGKIGPFLESGGCGPSTLTWRARNCTRPPSAASIYDAREWRCLSCIG
jgi:hypothetical protein